MDSQPPTGTTEGVASIVPVRHCNTGLNLCQQISPALLRTMALFNRHYTETSTVPGDTYRLYVCRRGPLLFDFFPIVIDVRQMEPSVGQSHRYTVTQHITSHITLERRFRMPVAPD